MTQPRCGRLDIWEKSCSRHLSANAPVFENVVYQAAGKFVVPTMGERIRFISHRPESEILI